MQHRLTEKQIEFIKAKVLESQALLTEANKIQESLKLVLQLILHENGFSSADSWSLSSDCSTLIQADK